MIPLFHLITSLTVFFCSLASIKLYSSYQRSQNIHVGNFLKGFVTIIFFFLALSLPVLFSDPVLIQRIYILSYISIFLAPQFVLKSAFEMFNFPLSRYIFPGTFLIIIITTFLNVIFSLPAQLIVSGAKFYYWGQGTPVWLALSNGILISLFVAGCSFSFFLGRTQSLDKLLRARALLLGWGLAVLTVSAFLYFVVAPQLQESIKLWVSVISAVLTIPGFSLMLAGIYLKVKEDQFEIIGHP